MMDYEQLTEEKEEELEELLRQNAKIELENKMMATHAMKLQASFNNEESMAKLKKSRKIREKTTLTTAEKVEILNTEFEAIQNESKDTRRNSEKLIDTLKALIQEVDVRTAELKKNAYDFRRDIVIGAENPRNGQIMAEKILRYMEHRLQDMDVNMEKIRMKNITLKNTIQKVSAQLKQKEEIGDALHYIDFHQLQIENKQYLEKIDERNKTLLKLKSSTTNTLHTLNEFKKNLGDIAKEEESLRADIQDRRQTLEKYRVDINKIGDEIVREQNVNRKLNATTNDAIEMPNIEDYISLKAQKFELENQVKLLTRKVEIAALASSNRKKSSGNKNKLLK